VSQIRIGHFLRPWFLAPLLCLVYALAVVAHYGDSLALVTVGSDYAPAELATRAYSKEGYDGQSVYYLARYGFAAEPFLDVPAYRAQRILLPALGGIFSFGQHEVLPWVLLAVNLLALAGGTWLLESLLREYRLSPWYAIGYALSCGVFGAARLNTTETLAYALVIAAIVLARREKWLWSAVIFALAALAKEMTLVFPAAYTVHLLYQWITAKNTATLRHAVLFGAISLLPFLAWQMVLYSQFGAFGIGSGGDKATSFELIPLMGFIRILTEGGLAIFVVLAPIVFGFALFPTVWAFCRCWRDYQYSRAMKRNNVPASEKQGWTLVTTLLFANALLMLFVPFSTYRELLGILRFIVGLQIAVILYAAEKRQYRALMYSTIWFVGSFLVIFSDFAAKGV
jgi:hypothetical protein